jgi:alkaline phosphatase D
MASRMAQDPLPHFMLWLGDNLYFRSPSSNGAAGEYDKVEYMALRYREVRAKPMLQRLFAATQHYAIWDDHDYGPNNANKEFALKHDSLRLFREYWPNPEMGCQDLPGTWTRFRHQDAEFFLLDNRFNRDSEKAPPDAAKAMFGPAQMDWLKHSLRASTATFKLVAGGTQFLSENRNGAQSGWHSYQAERDDFLGWLAKERITGVALLSGDRHNTQMFRHVVVPENAGTGSGIILNEFSCSPMTSKLIKLSKTDWENPRLDKDCAVEARNYGTLECSGKGSERKLTARCFDADGKLLWTRVLVA